MSHTPRNRRTRRLWSITLTLAMVAAFLPLGFSAQAAGNKALQLNGTSQYATVGTEHVSCAVRSSRWRPGSSGPAGATRRTRAPAAIDDVIPLISEGHGRGRDRNADNVNYFFGHRRLKRHAGRRLRGAGRRRGGDRA